MMTRKAVIFWFAAAVIVGLIVYSVLARVIENRRLGVGDEGQPAVIIGIPQRNFAGGKSFVLIRAKGYKLSKGIFPGNL